MNRKNIKNNSIKASNRVEIECVELTVGGRLSDMCALFRAERALGTDSVRTHPLPRSKLPATSFLNRFRVWYVLFSA